MKTLTLLSLILLFASCSKTQDDSPVSASEGAALGDVGIIYEGFEVLMKSLPQMQGTANSVGNSALSPVGEAISSDFWYDNVGTFYSYDENTDLTLSQHVANLLSLESDQGIFNKSSSFFLASCLIIGSTPKTGSGLPLGTTEGEITAEFIETDSCGPSETLSGLAGIPFTVQVEAISGSEFYDYKIGIEITDGSVDVYIRVEDTKLTMFLISPEDEALQIAFSSSAVMYDQTNGFFNYQYVEFDEGSYSKVQRVFTNLNSSVVKILYHENIDHSNSTSMTYTIASPYETIDFFVLSASLNGTFNAPYNSPSPFTNGNACVDVSDSNIFENETNACANGSVVLDSSTASTLGASLVDLVHADVIAKDYSNVFPEFDGFTMLSVGTGLE
jgi:hypothetical protein